ncbi:MAG TPA: hypothetical protein VG713_21415, partial [Pirellulales bacterium]|nr:hypothetical protein [Pirellulales bacterium]
KKRCTTCHKVGDVGHAVGPDLLALRDRSAQSLLIAMLDPNRAVETKFVNYLAITTDGLSHNGMLVGESAAGIALLGPEGKQVNLPRTAIEELQSTGKSLMPEGLEKDLSNQDLADLIMLFSLPKAAGNVEVAVAAPKPMDDEDEEPEYRPGLVARYADAHGNEAVRRDGDLQFAWDATAPDDRLEPIPFTATWRGRLFSIAPGKYQLKAFAAGRVRLTLEGKTLLDATVDTPQWLAAEPIELAYGYHPLAIDYSSNNGAARLGLFWSGPQFQLEPVPERHLFHLPADEPPSAFEHGRLLTRALRCAACHEFADERATLSAPALDRLRGNLEPGWMVEWLSAKPLAGGETVTRRMPHFDLTADDARAIVTYLHAVSNATPPRTKFDPSLVPTPAPEPGKKKPKKPRTKPSAAEGQRLVNTIGCLACHRLDARGAQALFGGGDLTAIADKRPGDFFAHWLTKPEEINRSHRMPVFRLAAIEWADVAMFLATLKGNTSAKPWQPALDDHDTINRGRRLVAEHRCGSCHVLPEAIQGEGPPRLRLSATSRWDTSCLGTPQAKSHRPGYQLSATQQAAVREYIQGAKPQASAIDGRFVLAERNCLGCHSRDLQPGIAANLEAVVAADGELSALLPTLAPPSLSGVGDKLHDDALAAAITLKNPPLRPWLAIRMPKFPLAGDEMRALTDFLIGHDRVPDLPQQADDPTSDPGQVLAARRLVTADGFGCTSCHKIGNSEPLNVALNAHGTDLTLLGERIRRPWFDRWVRNPARIVPRMEMPAIQLPVRGLLHDNVDEQLAAVWNTLNTPGFNPPPPGPVRIVRARNVAGVDEPASVLTDLLEVGEKVYIRPLIIGLPNRHNVLFDLESGRLANWWLGDTAMERTRGKAWYWTPGGDGLFAVELEAPEVSLSRAGKLSAPLPQGQVAALLDSFSHTKAGVSFACRYLFTTEQGQRRVIRIHQSIEPRGAEGFVRRMRCHGLLNDETLVIQPFAALSAAEAARAGKLPVQITIEGQAEPAADGKVSLSPASPGQSNEVAIVYSTSLSVDQFPVVPPSLPKPEVVKLDVVPGWSAVQLPLPAEEMPTGIDWRADGTLVFSSLKGRVCVAKDTDGDGLEDTVAPLSDDLPAPYGVAANADGTVDVICKYGLVRLYDSDGDGRAERSEIVADGWGMTTDYHDWAVGLPRDRNGDYIVALPCQQDQRDEAAARWRGEALRLIPREPTADDPRRFRVEPFAAGLRFPMGVAINHDGAIFASDNQGNYNPFNEINNLEPGQRYGFINKRDVRPGFNPPFQTAAIDLPHPWTRSVNGLCFLDTPASLKEQTKHNAFGPFEGHLLGCEYTTLRLIRMTLERVGDVYQGAAYPFSIAPADRQPTFEGPVVSAVAPDGDLYVGNMRDSGWGGGQNTGSMVRLQFTGQVPLGIRTVRATHDGFVIEFTGEIDRRRAADTKQYSVLSYRRISTPAYGGENVDERAAHVRSVAVAPDARAVAIKLDALRAGHVYELRLGDVAAEGKPLHPAEAYYTLRRVPPTQDSSAASRDSGQR